MLRTLAAAVVAVTVVVGVGVLVAQDQQTLRIHSALGATDPAFPEYVAALAGSPLTVGDRYDVLVNGVEFFPAMLSAIASAHRRINLETYILDQGEVARQFIDALVAAARRGVEVNILLDAIGSQTADPAHLDRLKAAGCHVVFFNPLRWYSLEEVNYRTHRKLLLVDGEVAFTGGAGIADHWLGNAETPDHWRETHVRVVGPAVRHLEASFYENWAESAGQVKPSIPLISAPPAAGGARSIVTWSSPTGGSSSMKRLYLLSIGGARRTLDICTPYFITDASSDWALEQAIRRGVRVRVLVEGEITDARSVKYASRASYEKFLRWGIEIYEYVPTMMHAKSMIVDEVWSMVGSSNFDNRSLELNDELNVTIRDPGVAARLAADFEADLRRSQRLRLADWEQRSARDRVRERFWGMFREVF